MKEIKKIKLLTFSTLINPHQYKLVKAGQSAVVYEFILPRGSVGFIEDIGNTYFPNTYLTLVVDGEEQTIEREIAPINLPKRYSPPILVKNYIRWIAYNNDTEDHLFEVVCDGFIIGGLK
jgi:hypothetical protein